MSRNTSILEVLECMKGLGQSILKQGAVGVLAELLFSGTITWEQTEQFVQESIILKGCGLNTTDLVQAIFDNSVQIGVRKGMQIGVTGILDKLLAAGKITREYADQLAKETLTEQNLPSED